MNLERKLDKKVGFLWEWNKKEEEVGVFGVIGSVGREFFVMFRCGVIKV